MAVNSKEDVWKSDCCEYCSLPLKPIPGSPDFVCKCESPDSVSASSARYQECKNN